MVRPADFVERVMGERSILITDRWLADDDGGDAWISIVGTKN